MKVLKAPLTATREQIRNLFTEGVDAVVIENTDIIIVKPYYDIYTYSAKVVLGGDRANIARLDNAFTKYGYKYHYGIYSTKDWEFVKNRINNTVFKKGTKETYDTAKKIVKEGYGELKAQKYPEYGVELEVESDTALDRTAIANIIPSLIQDVGSDPSVYGGAEIRFNHPTLNKWKLNDISLILNKCKELGAYTEKGTAGMHIHISRANIKEIARKFENNLETMQSILYPINCRKKRLASGASLYYGVGSNIYRNQTDGFGTLEIRAWNSTLDPKLFLARIKFCKTFTNWLAKATDITVESFFKFMNKSEKENYKYMLMHTENPHEWGFPVKAVNALLS